MDKAKWGNMFTAIELTKLYQAGELDQLFKKMGGSINPTTLLASANDTSVFKYGDDQVIKVVPKNIRFFKHFGRHNSGGDFKKYINRMDPYFLPVEDILYEDENIFAYTQKKCKVIESKRINKRVVREVFQLVQFMLANNVLLTDLAPHNLGISGKRCVVFDYHGLHRLTKDGKIKRPDWWRRLARNLTRFMCSLYGAHKRAEYSALMQNCDEKVVRKMENDPEIPRVFSKMIRYLFVHENNASIETVCTHLENCITHLK